jgi:hypothetical protein
MLAERRVAWPMRMSARLFSFPPKSTVSTYQLRAGLLYAIYAHFEYMLAAGLHGNTIWLGVGSLYTHEMLVIVGTEVGHGLRFGDPRIPDHRAVATALLDHNPAL